MLNVLSRAFTLAKNRIHLRPVIEKLPVDNCRKLYFAEAEYKSLCKHLPDDFRIVAQVAHITGWRISDSLQAKTTCNWDAKKRKLILEAGADKRIQRSILSADQPVAKDSGRAGGRY